MTIKVLEKTEGCLPTIIKKGEWIDLALAEDVDLRAPYVYLLNKKIPKGKEIPQDVKPMNVEFDSTKAKLGICMEMPKGCEALVVPRSSAFLKHGIIMSNSVGIIDSTYCSDKDEWGFPIIALRETTIPKGTRVAQFRIQLSQKATVWQKLKWLFSSSIKIKKVDSLDNPTRGGFGEGTGSLPFVEIKH